MAIYKISMAKYHSISTVSQCKLVSDPVKLLLSMLISRETILRLLIHHGLAHESNLTNEVIF